MDNANKKTRRNKVIVVLGTTASGKTHLAVALAKKFNGEIVSADSRQVYRDMDIGTGKDLKEYQILNLKNQKYISKIKNNKTQIPHYLIDIVSPKRQFTVAEFQKRAYKAIDDILSRGKLPIICGGTGLYIDAIVKGFAFQKFKVPRSRTNSLRGRQSSKFKVVRKKLDILSLSQLLLRLKKVDPQTYKIIDKKNRRRVQRALEIYFETGVPKSEQLKAIPPPYNFLKIGVTFPKEILKKRIEKRLEQRFQKGMIKEVEKLKRQGVSWKRLENFGLEYRWIAKNLQAKISKTEMKELLLKDITSFAKRQITWFKKDQNIHWIKSYTDIVKLVKNFFKSS